MKNCWTVENVVGILDERLTDTFTSHSWALGNKHYGNSRHLCMYACIRTSLESFPIDHHIKAKLRLNERNLVQKIILVSTAAWEVNKIKA